MSPVLPTVLDSTMRSCLRSCPQKYFKEFVLGLRPAALSVDLHAGSCFASALERIRKSIFGESRMDLNGALLSAYPHFLQEWGDFTSFKDTPKTQTNVWAAVESYFDQYPPLSDSVQPYSHEGVPTYEFTFAIPLNPSDGFEPHPVTGDPWLYGGRFDMLGAYHSRPCVLDEKTTTSIGAAWYDQWQLRGQFIGYVWACQQLGINLDTVVCRGVGILKTKISHAEAVKQYSDFIIERWLNEVRKDTHLLARLWRDYLSAGSSAFDFNLADACSSYGGCPFKDLCASSNEEIYYSQYAVRRWNPTARNPVEEISSPTKELSNV